MGRPVEKLVDQSDRAFKAGIVDEVLIGQDDQLPVERSDVGPGVHFEIRHDETNLGLRHHHAMAFSQQVATVLQRQMLKAMLAIYAADQFVCNRQPIDEVPTQVELRLPIAVEVEESVKQIRSAANLQIGPALNLRQEQAIAAYESAD